MIKNNVVQGGGAGGSPVICEATSLVSSTDPFGDGSLVAKYLFDWDIEDLTNTYNGSVVSGTMEYATGKFADGLTGFGISERFDTTMQTNDTMSISMWVKFTAFSTNNNNALISTGDGTNITWFAIGNSFSQLCISMNVGYACILSGLTINDNNWHHLVMQKSGGYLTAEIYIDGVIQTITKDSGGGAPVVNGTRFGISGSNDKPNQDLNLDQVEFYNRMLTSTEVQSLYTASKYSCDPTPQDYIAFYPLTGTAEDVTGNYDGTEVGATYVDDVARGAVYSGVGSITIPSTGGTYCSYWKNTGASWSHTTTSTIPSSLTTNKYSSLRIYTRTLTAQEITDIYDYELVTHHIPVDDGLVAYYPLHTNSMDNYYNQYDGVDNGVTYDGQSASFIGVNNSKISTSFAIPTTSSSISFWAKVNTGNAGGACLFGYTPGSQQSFLRSYGVSLINGAWNVLLSPTSDMLCPVLDTFYYCTIVDTGTTIDIYRDSVKLVNTAPYDSMQGFKFNTLGLYQDGSLDNLTGNLANIRAYNRAISEAEILDIYNFEKSQFGL